MTTARIKGATVVRVIKALVSNITTDNPALASTTTPLPELVLKMHSVRICPVLEPAM
jgi:hypothetical protein